MNALHQHLHDILEDEDTDLALIAARAQREGTAVRRRRRLAVAGGSLAVLAVLGVGAVAAGLVGDEPGRASVVAGQGSPSPTGGNDTLALPADALVAAVTAVAPGSVSGISNDDGAPAGYPQVKGELTFAPSDGSPAGLVSVTIAQVDEQEVYPGGEAQILECGDQQTCRVVTLEDGSRARADDGSMDLGEAGVWEYLTVDRVVGDTWIHFEAQAARDWPSEQAEVLAEHAPLTLEELTEVASLPVWAG